eukprot:TRINITY_DN1033_c0_g1_i3.p1 TRINITY_DN1033_c0_g1~~TRINITY_DN1033_c0_g1_i3.p1  ORF type:complete len:123 (-),score=0.82 TRINITY_DN1033_c0_g1_i3:138-506(-)
MGVLWPLGVSKRPSGHARPQAVHLSVIGGEVRDDSMGVSLAYLPLCDAVLCACDLVLGMGMGALRRVRGPRCLRTTPPTCPYVPVSHAWTKRCRGLPLLCVRLCGVLLLWERQMINFSFSPF